MSFIIRILLVSTFVELYHAFPHESQLRDDEIGRYFSPQADGMIPEHQIVYVEHVSGNTQSTRHVTRDSIVENTASFKLRGFDEDFHIDVTQEKDFFGSQTPSCRYLDDTGTAKIDKIPTDCFYSGSLRGHESSVVSINTCSGMSGTITREGFMPVYIEPLKEEHAIKRGMQEGLAHVLYKHPKHQPFECGVKDELHNYGFEHQDDVHINEVNPDNEMSEKYLKLHMVADHQYYAAKGDDSCKCLTAMFQGLAVRMSLLPHMHLLLNGISVVKTNTNLNTTNEIGPNLGAIYDWGHAQPEQADWDHVVVVIPFNMEAAGLAWVCSACGDYKYSCSYANSLIGVQVLAHEIGHNICLDHDVGAPGCGIFNFVMGAAAGWDSFEMGWSDCSTNQYLRKINTQPCLDDN